MSKYFVINWLNAINKPRGNKMLLRNGIDYQPSHEEIQILQTAYPKLDIAEELRKMDAWCWANSSKRKTPTGVRRFINAWLSRAKPNVPHGTSTRHRSLQEDLTDTSWAT